MSWGAELHLPLLGVLANAKGGGNLWRNRQLLHKQGAALSAAKTVRYQYSDL